MIVNKDYVFISTPKCATHTMYDVLQTHFEGKRLKPYHRREVPEEYKDVKRFTVVRNPYSRAVCMWWVIIHGKRYFEQYRSYVSSATFEAYLKWVMKPSNGTRRLNILTATQSDWHPRPINYLNIETLQEEFDNLFCRKVILPKHLKRTPETLNVLNNTTREMIREWCKDDFRRFDYE